MERRRFLERLATVGALMPLAAAGGAAASPGPAGAPRAAGRRLRVLVLGGTNYVGPHLVRAALERGHDVTVFNRGYTNPDLFAHVERRAGNRFEQRAPGLSALRGSETWDLVLDTWAHEPVCVDDTARMLADRAGRYVYISSIAVLGGFRASGLDEAAPTVAAEQHVRSLDPELGYAERKRAAELAVLRAFGERGTVLRCSSIYGHDASASPRNQQSYWPLRFLSGEPVLVPDDPTAVLQWTDARDVGRFAVHAGEAGLGGVFHLINPPQPVPFLDYIGAWAAATGGHAQVARAPRGFLAAHGVQPWSDLPVYIPGDDPEPGFFRIAAARAHATGFPFRPLGETIADVIRTYVHPPAPEVTEGMDRRRELALVWELRAAAAAR